eukprot:scaffold4589_cov106-Isochrysis_galbana.AAC.2
MTRFRSRAEESCEASGGREVAERGLRGTRANGESGRGCGVWRHLVDELKVSEDLDGAHFAHLAGARAQLHHVERVVVADGAVEARLGCRVLPRLRQHAVVEEGGAVCVVSELALLDVLHDRVVRHLLVHLQLGGGAPRDLAHEAHLVGSRAGRVQRDLVPGRDDGTGRVGEVGGEGGLAEGCLGRGAHGGGEGQAAQLLGVGHPVARLLPDVVVGDDLPALVHHEARRDALGRN